MPGGLMMTERAADRDGLRLDMLYVALGPVLADWPAGLVVELAVQPIGVFWRLPTGYDRAANQEGRWGMNRGKVSDMTVGAVGDLAGAVVDPRAGLGKLRSALTSKAGVTLIAGLLVGYLVARSQHRS